MWPGILLKNINYSFFFNIFLFVDHNFLRLFMAKLNIIIFSKCYLDL